MLIEDSDDDDAANADAGSGGSGSEEYIAPEATIFGQNPQRHTCQHCGYRGRTRTKPRPGM